jgi:UDPglucose 6-dehydrogenase
MLAQRISSINSLSALCEKTDANIDELSTALGMDKRIGKYFLKASVGFGGSCFQKDILNLVYLSKFYGLNEVAEYWHQVIRINNYQKERFAQKIINYFDGDLIGKRIAILGWAFKANTNDSRESASIKVSEILFNKGASLSIYDPRVNKETIFDDIENLWTADNHFLDNKIDVFKELSDIKQVDAFVILTEWKEFELIDNNEESNVIFDGRNINQNKNKVSIGK